ncbi:MAG: MerC domain-containing protein [Pseudomonadota bacterium]
MSPSFPPEGQGPLGGPSLATPVGARPRVDGAAMGIAGLCLVHCLLLPAAAVLLPFLAVMAEAEWLHRLLVVSAFPLSVGTVILRFRQPKGAFFAAATLFGLTLLAAAVMIEGLERYEVPLTVSGGLVLFMAHGAWWIHHQDRHTRP